MAPLLETERNLRSNLDAMLWVFDHWRDARAGLTGGLNGVEMLTHQSLHYWQKNRRYAASDWEITMLLRIDAAHLIAREAEAAQETTDHERHR